jgi:hypothetical protein
MIVQCGESNSNPNYLIIISSTKKSDTFNVTKAVARKFTLMQIVKVRAASYSNSVVSSLAVLDIVLIINNSFNASIVLDRIC